MAHGIQEGPIGGIMPAVISQRGPLGLGLLLKLDAIGGAQPAGTMSTRLAAPSLIADQIAFDLFESAVLARQIERARGHGHPYFPPVPEEELGDAGDGRRIRRAAAEECRALIAKAQAQAIKDGRTDIQIRVISGYRDYKQDALLWHKYFPQYYKATRADRTRLRGGPHGRAAIDHLAHYISPLKAAPGFSKHSNGVAVDFGTTEHGTVYTTNSKKAHVNAWTGTWFHTWLRKHAAEFGFLPLASEPWHWEYSK